MLARIDRWEERRAEPRRRALKGATVRFNNGYGALECVLRNESPKGALLVFGEATAVPTMFELHVAGQAAPRHARVRWRTTTSLGVELG
jgi:hypothetical protein